MNDSYQLKVNSDLVLESSEFDNQNIDLVRIDKKNLHVLKNNQSFKAEIVSEQFDDRSYTIAVNGNNYQVKIQNNLDQLINQLGFSLANAKQVNSVKAPMPGLILDINVSVGQEVAENDNLLILEAMKMENNLSSPRAGIIKSINVSKGDTVDKGQLLIEFE
ncbi:acetyl-CoA carboxylase biotin carboxyl carrier protein subunit [Myroides guanonis]|uniref:Biotin-requiring enzyme n=1 Tax=Myroides guanonis TaxID=1150112 RepID=A0A1I3SL36_9FLAO|nr:acetyl-CoA carboxylase biotin carboxyl carrier protein subunit [Myroides guanonis]SFJ58341.1 Biotin-requiring enzyme [Myroides guanonis]